MRHVTLSDEGLAALDRLCEAHGMTRSAIVDALALGASEADPHLVRALLARRGRDGRSVRPRAGDVWRRKADGLEVDVVRGGAQVTFRWIGDFVVVGPMSPGSFHRQFEIVSRPVAASHHDRAPIRRR